MATFSFTSTRFNAELYMIEKSPIAPGIKSAPGAVGLSSKTCPSNTGSCSRISSIILLSMKPNPVIQLADYFTAVSCSCRSFRPHCIPYPLVTPETMRRRPYDRQLAQPWGMYSGAPVDPCRSLAPCGRPFRDRFFLSALVP